MSLDHRDPASTTRSDDESAGLLRRAFAQTIDVGLAAVIGLCALQAAQRLVDSGWGAWLGQSTWFAWSAIFGLPAWLLLALLEWLPGHASPGKRVLRMHLVGPQRGRRPSFARVALRTAIKLLPWHIGALALCLPHPWDPREPLELGRLLLVLGSNLWLGLYLACAAMTRRRQSLHDLVVGTVVVRTASAEACGP